MKRTPWTLFLITMLMLSMVHQSFACACCAERGTYFASTSPVDEYEDEILTNMKFNPAAELYLDEAGFEVIDGLEGFAEAFEASETASEFSEIALKGGYSKGVWKLSLAMGKLTGTIAFTRPAEKEYRAADIHDGKGSPGGGPLLYKELVFNGKVDSGEGFFSKGIKAGTEFRLVFQGRGNGCNNVEDYTHWRLSVAGPDARYSFFGKLDSGKVPGNETAEGSPSFDEYKVALWSGQQRTLNLASHRNGRMFRTRLREAWKGGVNFAGHFIYTYWGCGSGCVQGAIIDAKTGRIYFPDEMAGMGFGGLLGDGEPMDYRNDSRLFVIRGATGESEEPGTTWLVWEDTAFRKLLFRKSD